MLDKSDCVPYDTKEDDVSKIEFTEEEAKIVKNAWKGYTETVPEPSTTKFTDWLDAHTKKPLTFPCPVCGYELEVALASHTDKDYYASCPAGCAFDCGYFRADTKAELSEALNKEV